MLFWNKICGFAIIFFLSGICSNAQNVNSLKISSQKSLILPCVKSPLYLSNIINTQNALLIKPSSIISQNYYTEHFGIMCKKELAIEKATKIPLRFRLGSLQQCNYLEGKK